MKILNKKIKQFGAYSYMLYASTHTNRCAIKAFSRVTRNNEKIGQKYIMIRCIHIYVLCVYTHEPTRKYSLFSLFRTLLSEKEKRGVN